MSVQKLCNGNTVPRSISNRIRPYGLLMKLLLNVVDLYYQKLHEKIISVSTTRVQTTITSSHPKGKPSIGTAVTLSLILDITLLSQLLPKHQRVYCANHSWSPQATSHNNFFADDFGRRGESVVMTVSSFMQTVT